MRRQVWPGVVIASLFCGSAVHAETGAALYAILRIWRMLPVPMQDRGAVQFIDQVAPERLMRMLPSCRDIPPLALRRCSAVAPSTAFRAISLSDERKEAARTFGPPALAGYQGGTVAIPVDPDAKHGRR